MSFVRVAQAAETEGHTIALFSHQGCLYAVDNRCPHMGFPLYQIARRLHRGELLFEQV